MNKINISQILKHCKPVDTKDHPYLSDAILNLLNPYRDREYFNLVDREDITIKNYEAKPRGDWWYIYFIIFYKGYAIQVMEWFGLIVNYEDTVYSYREFYNIPGCDFEAFRSHYIYQCEKLYLSKVREAFDESTS